MRCYHPNKAFTVPWNHFYKYALLPPEQGIHKAMKATFLGTRCYHTNKPLGTRGRISAPEQNTHQSSTLEEIKARRLKTSEHEKEHVGTHST
jgi:hypothetical protein